MFLFLKKQLFVSLLLTVLFFQNNSVHGQCVLACNDLVNVDLQLDGTRIIDADMILEAPQLCPFPLQIDVFVNTVSIGNVIDCSLEGQTLDVIVTEIGGNGNSCPSKIRIEDKSGPLLNCRADTVVACGLDPTMINPPTIQDNCDPNPEIFFSDSTVNFICTNDPFIKVIYRTWRGRDVIGNLSFNCNQVIYFERPDLNSVIFPEEVCIQDTFANPITQTQIDAIAGTPTFGGAPINIACKFNTFFEDTRLEICEGSFKLLRKWILLNCCTNETIEDFQLIEIKDTVVPVLVCLPDSTISASGTQCSASFDLPVIDVSDNRTQNPNIRIEWSGGTIFGNGGFVTNLPLGDHEFTYIAEDDCGNIDSCIYTLTVVDDVPPVPICVERVNITVLTTDEVCLRVDSLDLGSFDNCCLNTVEGIIMGESAANFREEICLDCQDVPGPVMVVVRFTDCNDNFNECMVEVSVEDPIPPTISCPSNDTFDCTEDISDTTLTGVATAMDNCDNPTVSFIDDTSQVTMCNTGVLSRVWTATDAGGSTAVCTQTITITDPTPTVFLLDFPFDTTIFCPADVNNLQTGQPVVVSDCEQWDLDVNDNINEIGCSTIVIRTFNFIEACSGVDTFFSQIITIIDNAPPVFDQMSGSFDTTFQCSTAPDIFQIPTAQDNCTDANVRRTRRDTIFGSCDNDFIVNIGFVAEDDCGNISDTFLIKITVKDTINPVFLNTITDLTIDCSEPTPFISANTEDNCGFVTTFTRIENLTPVCPEVERIKQTVIATDACGNMDSISRIISKIDTIPPTAFPLADSIYTCPEDIPVANPDVVVGEMDNCTNVTVTLFQNDTIENRCVDTLLRIYQLADDCGNISFINHRLILRDTVRPRVTSCPGAFIDTITSTALNTCDLEVQMEAFYIDNCNDLNVTVTHNSPFAFNPNSSSATGIYPLGTHTFTFTGIDECLNANTECEVILTVIETDPPGISCKAEPILIYLDSMGMVTIDSSDIFELDNPTNSDQCSDVFYEVLPNMFNCDDFNANPSNTVEVLGIIRDTFGNQNSCAVTVTLQDSTGFCSGNPALPPGGIGGSIWYENELTPHNVFIDIFGSKSATTKTEDTGTFQFEDLNEGDQILIAPYKTDLVDYGVNTLDLILMEDMILGEGDFTPEQVIAADVNRSGSVTTLDMIELRKIILNERSIFTSNTPWRFIDKTFVFDESIHPLAQNFPEIIRIEDHQNSLYNYDFITIKTGDLNQSGTIDSIQNITNRSNASTYFEMNNISFKKGDRVVALLNSIDALRGFQFEFSFDSKILDFKQLEPNSAFLKEENFNLSGTENGNILISCNKAISQKIPLFKIEFTANKDGQLSEFIRITSNELSAQAYTIDKATLEPKLRFYKNGFITNQSIHFDLFQNQPNPFKASTTIECWSQHEMNTTLEIYSLSGKTIFRKEEKLKEGINQFEVSGHYFDTDGVYFYKLTTPFGVKTNRMIYLK